MENFETLMKQAVNIKTGQMMQKRVKFEASPVFIKAGLYYLQKYENVRKQGFGQQYIVCDLMKTRGNTFFKNEEFEKAAREYEQALSIFRYIRNRNLNWKNEGILDDDLEFINYEGNDEYERSAIKTIKVSLYNNLAACYLKCEDYRNAKNACDSVLELDSKQAKALYRRAKAQTSDINATIDDYKSAIEDLKKAYMICPEDTSIQQALAKAKLEMNKMKMSGETFKNIFNKPIYDDVKASQKPESAKEEQDAPKSSEFLGNTPKLFTDLQDDCKDNSTRAASTESAQRSPLKATGETGKDGLRSSAPQSNPENLRNKSVKENQPINNKDSSTKKKKEDVIENLVEGKDDQLFNFFEKTGRKQEAAELKEKMKEALAAKQQLDKLTKLDFDNPNSDLAVSAEKFGLDLNDPLVREELAKLKKKNLKDLKNNMKGIFKDISSDESSGEEETKKDAKTNNSTNLTQIQNNTTNNYYINNNYYANGAEVSPNSPEKSKSPDEKAKIRDSSLNKTEPESQSKVNRIMNLVIICVAVGLFLITLILQSNNKPSSS